MSAGERVATFQAFSWLSHELRNDKAAVFAVRVKELSRGVQKCLELIEESEVEREHILSSGPPADGESVELPLLSVTDTSILMRLSIAITEIIGEQAEQFFLAAERRLDETRGAGHE
jgi:hypothetical protein